MFSYHLLLVLQVMSSSFLLANSLTPDIVKGMINLQPDPPDFDDQHYEISPKCLSALTNMTKTNALKALDALGKPGAGFLFAGNVNMLGHFDECESLADFHYCMISINTSQSPMLPVLYGLCAPADCTELDIYNTIDKFINFQTHGFSVEETGYPMCAKYPHRPFDWKFALTVAFFSLLFLLVVTSSLYHAWYHSPACKKVPYAPLDEQSIMNHPESHIGLPENSPSITTGVPSGTIINSNDQEVSTEQQFVLRREGSSMNTFNKIFFSFALPQNLPKLLSGKVSNDSIPCIHGIRVISMLWVILGHTFLFIAPVSMMNPVTLLSWLSRYGFLAISNAFFSVDSFFFLSGLLVTYLTLKQMKKKCGKIPWHWFYFHRYWRLTPVLAVTMLFYVYIVPYFGHGPYAQTYGARPYCSKYWWTNLLYINNFYPVKGEEECIGWVWYLANDMQFFVISPLILIPLYFMPMIGLPLIAVLCLGSITVTGILAGIYNFPPGMSGLMTPPDANQPSFTNAIYYKPYCRITPYLVGMALGYIFYKYPKKSIKIHWLVVLILWVLACGIGYTCVYSIYPNINGHPWSAVGNGFYQGLCRCAWGIFLAWVVFACHYGYGGWVNSFLSHPAWAPLGRLTYTAYLLHPIILMIYSAHCGAPTYVSFVVMAFNFAGVALVSYGCAAIFSLMLEFPLVGLEKMFIPRN